MEYEQVRKILKEKADNGDINAKIAIALNKINIEDKVEEGISDILELSYENEIACHILFGIVRSLKIERLYEETYKICEKFANRNIEVSINDMGVIYQLGELGKEKDIVNAIKYFQKAIDFCQSGVACQSIGAIYYNGTDVKQDYEEAYKYFKLGAQYEYADCEESLANMYVNGIFVKQDYVLASYWYEKAFNHGNVNVAVYLANLYLPINNCLNDEEQALEWYEKGAKYNITECLIGLGFLYESGTEIQKNYQKSFECYKKAGELGDGRGFYFLGLQYLIGDFVTKNKIIAKKYLEYAKKLGVEEAEEFIAECNSSSNTAELEYVNTYLGVDIQTTVYEGSQDMENKSILEKEERRRKNRELGRAAAAANNISGYIDEDLGYLIANDGRMIMLDSEMGYTMDLETKNIELYDKKLNMRYNKDGCTYLNIDKDIAYNFKTKTYNITDRNFTFEE